MALSPFLTRNQIILAKTSRAAAGVDAAPDITKAVLMEPPTSDPQIQNATTNEMVGGFDTSPPSFTGGWSNFSATVHVKGSGTAGTAPDWDPLMRGCAMGKTVFASAVTGTAQAGGTSTITLARRLGGRQLLPRPGHRPTGGTGTQYKAFRIIKSYNGSTKVATVTRSGRSTYARRHDHRRGAGQHDGLLHPQGRALPAGQHGLSRSSPSTATCRTARRQRSLDKLIDWQGNCTSVAGRNDCTFAFTGQGGMLDDTDVSWPGTPTFLNQVYPPLINGWSRKTTPTKLKFTIDFGINVTTEEDPNAANGYSQAVITQRATKGTARMPRLLKATLDVMAALRAGTPQTLHGRLGLGGRQPDRRHGPRRRLHRPHLAPTCNGVLHDASPTRRTGANAGVFIYVY
jgi:hypothetical protein